MPIHHRRASRLPPLSAFAVALALGATTAAQPGRSMGQEATATGSWVVQGDFDGAGEAENISGVACALPPGPTRACLMASDENHFARLFTLSGTTIRLGATVPLLPPTAGGKKRKETDAEGAAFDRGFYYVIGSHGASKKKGEYQASRFFVYRFPGDAATGQPGFDVTADDPPAAVKRSNKLEAIIAGLPALAPFACGRGIDCVPLQEHGVNIEGLGVRDGQLYVGFRAPIIDGQAVVVRVAVEAVFGTAEPRPDLFRLALGPGTGVRDLAAVPGGFLVLTGPELPETGGEVGRAEVFFWGGGSDPVVRLAVLGDMQAGAKPEAILPLGEDDAGYRVLVMSDGPPGGRPTAYSIAKPR